MNDMIDMLMAVRYLDRVGRKATTSAVSNVAGSTHGRTNKVLARAEEKNLVRSCPNWRGGYGFSVYWVFTYHGEKLADICMGASLDIRPQ